MRRYLETVVHRLPWVVAALIIVPLIVGVLSNYLLGTYQATALIWVESAASPATSGPGSSTATADVYAGRMRQLLMTRAFRDSAVAGEIAGGGASLPGQVQHDALVGQIGSVDVVSRGANLIDVESRSRNPTLALTTVSSVVEAFQSNTVATRQEAVDQAPSLFQQQVQQAQDNVVSLQSRLAALPTAASADQRARLTLELGEESDLLKALEDRRTTAFADSATRLADASIALRVIDPAQVDSQPKVSPVDLAMSVIGAFLVSVVLSLIVIGILSRIDRSVRTAADVRALTSVPVVTTPRVLALHDNGWPRLARRVFGTSGG